MSEPFVGEIKMFGGNFAPRGWAYCDGQLLAIAENDTLFSLLGTIYGGDGRTTFALPDLRGRVVVHQGQGPGAVYNIGSKGGVEQVTLTVNQLPTHSHLASASLVGTVDSASSAFWAGSTLAKAFGAPPSDTSMNAGAIANSGSSQPHDNMVPFTCIRYIIALFGIYPSRA